MTGARPAAEITAPPISLHQHVEAAITIDHHFPPIPAQGAVYLLSVGGITLVEYNGVENPRQALWRDGPRVAAMRYWMEAPNHHEGRIMGVIRSRYSPVRTEPDGKVTVELAGDHPGFTDLGYRARRDQLAALAASWRAGDPIPTPAYTDEEHAVWATVSSSLEPLHERYACNAFLEGKATLRLPVDRVPQLPEVTARLEPVTRFRYQPVAGLAPLREFYRSFDDGVFWSTQYLRHPSVPLYTPEPDVLHEVIGHANQLAGPGYADLYRLVGAAVARTRSEEALRFLSHVFWYTMEFGVVRERGELRAFGAGILSSVGETARFRDADLRAVDLVAMGRAEYDITRFQPVLYVWSSPAELHDGLSQFLETYDDSTPTRLIRKAG